MSEADDLHHLEQTAARLGLSPDLVRAGARRAVRLVRDDAPDAIGATRLGGLPDLPEGAGWPRWDVSAYDAAEIARAEEIPSPYMQKRAAEIRARGPRSPVPLSLVAQIRLADLDGLPHGLALPEDGTLWLFYALDEQPWGYCPTHRGGGQILYAPAGVRLERGESPSDLDPRLQLPSARFTARSVWTLEPNPSGLDDGQIDAWFELQQALGAQSPAPRHQIGGHPHEIQGDMRLPSQLVSSGLYLGGPSNPSRDELDRLGAGADAWRLVLQIATDDDLGWMWGDAGNVYFWMRAEDIEARAWDRAWVHLQCY